MSKGNSTENSGYLYALAAAISAGSIATLSKYLLSYVNPLPLSALTFLGSGLILIPYKFSKLPPRRSAILFIAIGLFGGALGFLLYLEGLSKTTAVNSALLVNGEILFTSIIAFSVFSERLNKNQLLAGLLILAGIIVVTTSLQAGLSFIEGLEGNILILGATLMWGIANNLQRVATQRFSAVFVSKFTNLIGGAILILFIPVAQASIVVPLSAFPYLIALVLNIVITTILFNVALGKIGAIRTILIFSTTSVFGSVFAMVFLSERISLIQIMGGAIILLGAYLIQRNEPRLDSSGQLTTT